jgi:dolichyl-diphosphooligosaccharide--protein glycosyltransferase
MKEVSQNCKFVLAWWDYGYMLGAVGHATTAVDPATLNTTKIQMVARALTGNEADVIDVLKSFKMLSPKTCVFAYEVFPLTDKNTVILLPQAGDFAKSIWMFRIAGYSDDVIFSKFIKIYYVVIGITPAGKQMVLIVNNPKDIQTTPEGVVVKVPGKGVVLLSRIINVSARPIYDIKDVFLYKAIYESLKKEGYRVLDALGRPINYNAKFGHFELLKPVIAHLYNPLNGREIPWIGVVALLKYVG